MLELCRCLRVVLGLYVERRFDVSESDGADVVSSTETGLIGDELRAHLEQLVPGIFQDGMLNAELLGELVGVEVSGLKDGKPQFGLMWAGRKEAAQALHTPSFASLAPVNADSAEWNDAENVFVVGDNLEVLKLMETAYNDQVKLVYIDPPYNTGNDFVYNDDFSDPVKHYLEVTGQTDAEGNKLVANTELSGRKHSNWMTMMYPRLVKARNMLTEDGLIVVSIDDNEHANLVALMKDVFGEENYLASAARVAKKTSNKGTHFAPSKDYLVTFSRNVSVLPPLMDEVSESYQAKFDGVDDRGNFATVGLYQATLAARPNQRYWIECPDGSFAIPPGSTFPDVISDASHVTPSPTDKVWRWAYSSYLEKKELIVFKKTATSPLLTPEGSQSEWNVYTKYYLEDRLEDGIRPRDFIDGLFNEAASRDLKNLDLKGVFDYAKPVSLVKKILTWVHDPDALIVDFFAGSGSTADAIHQLNVEDGGRRRYVVVQLDEKVPDGSKAQQAGFQTVADITRERIKRSREKYATEERPLSAVREYVLSKSSFKRKEVEDPDALFSNDPDTLHEDWTPQSVASEISLSLGARLDEPWHELSLQHGRAFKIGNIVIVTTTDVTDDLIDELVDVEANVVAFLEDSFGESDSVKANGFSKLKNAKKTVRFY